MALSAYWRVPWWRVIAATLAIAVALVALGVPRAAQAATTYTVTDPADITAGKNCAPGSPTCTFRLAVQTANVNPGSTINVTSGLTIVFAALGLAIDINAAMTIQTTAAANATIDGTNATTGVLRVVTAAPVIITGLNIQNSANILGAGAISTAVGTAVTLNNMTLTGNRCSGLGGSGGAINSNGSLTLNNVSVTNNGATCINGGGIYTNGPLTMTGGLVSGNTAANDGGGIYVSNVAGTSLNATGTSISNNTAGQAGGGVSTRASATMTRVHLSGNTTTQSGAGLIVVNTTATLVNSTVDGNHATAGLGGGIYVGTAQLTVTGSTLSANEAHAINGGGGAGGGVFMNGATASFTNSTMSGNVADNGGGAVYAGSSTLDLDSATVAANSAPTAAGVHIQSNVTGNLRNSILANTPSSCLGSLSSQGYNIDSGNTCGLAGPGDQTNTDPNLAPLANNGGSTLTMALLASSPAIDAGAPACPPPATDQRGVARPQSSRCDIGAYEFVPAPAPQLPAPPATGRN